VKALLVSDLAAVCLRIYPAYLRLVHRVLLEYTLEPAGSHGVWSLDDYR
jgi:serine/threonine-protein phosphatase 2A activator